MSQTDSAAAVNARSKALRSGLLTSLIQRGVGSMIPLITVPLALKHLGAENYGAWAIAVSLTTVFAYADLGIGAGLMTRLGRGGDESTRASDRVLVSSAYAMVGAISLVLIVLLFAGAAFFDLGRVFANESGADVEFIVVVTLAAFLMSVAASLIVRVQFALGHQTSSNLWQTAGSIAMLAGMWLTATYTTRAGWFVIATAGIPVATSVANSIWFFRFSSNGQPFSPAVRSVRWTTVCSLVSLGVRFLAIGLLMAAAVAADPWIVARTADLAEVAEFTIPYRLLSVVGLISVMALMPLWPMNARAVEEGDSAWISRTTWRIAILSGVAMAGIVALVIVFSQQLVEIWLDDAISVDRPMWIAFGLVCVIQAMLGPFFMVQNGAEVLLPQTISYIVLLTVLPLKWWLASRTGYEALPWVTAIGYVVIVVPGCMVGYRRALAIASSRRREGVG